MKNTKKITYLLPLLTFMLLPGCSFSNESKPNNDSNQQPSESEFDLSKYLDPNYKPSFDNICEVSYYAYFKKFISKNNTNKKALKKSISNETDEKPEEEVRYPIEATSFTFSNFLYFSFENVEKERNEWENFYYDFLEDKIGFGKINGLVVSTSFVEKMIILKNGDKYFSCVQNGEMSVSGGDEFCFMDFNSRHYFENFEDVKAPFSEEQVNFKLTFEDTVLDPRDLSTMTITYWNNIKDHFQIEKESIYYDAESSITCSIDELKELFSSLPDVEPTETTS